MVILVNDATLIPVTKNVNLIPCKHLLSCLTASGSIHYHFGFDHRIKGLDVNRRLRPFDFIVLVLCFFWRNWTTV